MLLFFMPALKISRHGDRTKENKAELKRTQPAHAKFAFAENTHYFAHLWHSAYSDAPFARNYCAYDGMDFHARDSAYNGVILTRNYCAYNEMDFMSRNTRYNTGDFDVSLLRLL